MNLLAVDVVHHLLDYPLLGPWLTAHHVLLLMVAAVMILGFRWTARKVTSEPGVEKGLASLVQVGLVWVRDEIVYAWLGKEKGRALLPFFWTLFFFILLSNLLGLLPAPFNPWHRTSTGNWMTTGALALVSLGAIVGMGMKTHGVGGFFLHLVPGGVPKYLWPFVWLIEFILLFVKPVALTIRLAANMTAGHAILAVLFGFFLGVAYYGNLFLGGLSTVASLAFVLFIMLFETLVALIQAYIFTVLTAIFVSLAAAEEH